MPVAFRVMLAVGFMLFPSVSLYAQESSSQPKNSSSVQRVYHKQVIELSPGYNQQTELPAYGKAMFYNPGVMEIVLENRLDTDVVDHCHECVGYVAMLRAGDLNRRIWIQHSDSTVEGPFHVVDAADQKHVYMLLGKSWVVDVDYETAMRWRMAGPRLVTLWDEPPSKYRVSTSGAHLQQDHVVDTYRHEKLDYFNQTYEYSGYVETLYIQ